ncbi:MAG: signal peptidase I, partial [Deltaproteobacteria bacterium]|nr:signal peptidase I [Deltaproteobacteria bacterium]
NKIFFNIGKPKRFDVVVFMFPDNNKIDFVKRVIGLPGETVEGVGGRIKINGQFIEDSHSHYDSTYYLASRDFGPIAVPEGQYFMMGDNRVFTHDSRAWGCVDASLLRGKAWRLYWSWDPARGLSFSQRLRTNRLGVKVN